MKDKKKKLPELIFPVIGIGSLFLSYYIVSLLDISGSFFCPERVGICAVPLLGKVIALLSSLSFWLLLIVYGIIFGGFLYAVHKKGYKI